MIEGRLATGLGLMALGALASVITGCSADSNSSGGTLQGTAANGSGATGSTGSGATSGGGTGNAGVVGTGATGSTIVTGGTPGNDTRACPDSAKFVYLVSETDHKIYSFAPDKTELTPIGIPSCSTAGGDAPNSMTVDRNGLGWVNYKPSGKLYKVTLKADASGALPCQDSGYQSGGGIGYSSALSLGFSSDTKGSSSETLFIADQTGDETDPPTQTGKGIGKIDLSGLAASALGPFTGGLAGSRCELTGTGDAELYGFFAEKPAKLVLLDKTNGSTPNPVSLVSTDGKTVVDASTGGYAFSFWGGYFWFYTASGTPPAGQEQANSSITRYNPTTKELTVVKADVGFVIVGAGVSTCAPTSSIIK